MQSRRDILKAGLALGATPLAGFGQEKMLTKPIPATGEPMPVIGLGTFRSFDVHGWWWEIDARRALVDRMIELGASVIDSSPQYEASEEIVGKVIKADNRRASLFLATKVWTHGRAAGEEQMRRSMQLMQAGNTIDLMQVHNLRDTGEHMPTIREWQQAGRIRYNGITHWEASALEDLEAAMQRHRPEFIQINYSLGERDVEKRILPLAMDLGVGVIINRPFMHGQMFRKVRELALPDWAAVFCDSWGQFFLKFVVSHPAVHCTIPGTDDMEHLEDNLGAGFGPLPDAATRARMITFYEGL